jgi:8-oxo-dGTP diphosphatase
LLVTITAGRRLGYLEPRPGVGVLLVRDTHVLLGQRRTEPGLGTWSPPGGKPEPGETPEQTALRELREETGLTSVKACRVGETTDELDGVLWRTTFFVVDWTGGEPRNEEPDKLGDWRWFAWDTLPAPLFAPFASLLALYPSAIASISTSTPDGSADTSTVERAG